MRDKDSDLFSETGVELFADNLFDEEFLIDAGNTGGGLGIPTFVRGNPVIGGLRLYAEM